MPEVYRVTAWRPDARRGEPGHAAFSPRSAQGGGRVDNPDLYATTYLSSTAAGAVGEVFGYHERWDDTMLDAGFAGPGTRYALLRFTVKADEVLDLDDPRNLLDRNLRPSRVVLTDREVTQAWARSIYLENSWTGASWWSRWDARWTSYGVWADDHLRAVGHPVPLHIDHDAILEAAQVLNRRLFAG